MTDTELRDSPDSPDSPGRSPRADLWYALGLFLCAAVAIAFAIQRQGGVLPTQDLDVGVFFLVYALVTIAIGYPHPHFGYYSFDRIAQVASILVLGPVDAAWINGLASLLYPWHRLWKGESHRSVLIASVNNSGMMALMILLGGSLYTGLGGQVPLLELTLENVVLLLALVIAMQLLNDLGMLGLLYVSGGSPGKFFNVFSIGLELLVDERTQDLHAKSLELERQATQDMLTGLYNRRFADQFLEQQLSSGYEGLGRSFVIALADIDLFKQINDGYSHATGDDVLRKVAQIMSGRCREKDVIARYGGEEFLLCFPETTLEAAAGICEELRAAVENEDWAPVGLGTTVTLSFGIAAATPDSTSESLLGTADLHLYAAKRRGRNRVVA